MKKHVERNIFADRICIVICVLLALAVFFLSFVGECRLAEIYECLAVANSLANDYDRQAHQLVATYNLTNNLRGSALSTRLAGVCLLFRACDGTLMQNALPLVTQAGFTGAFLLTSEALPGDEGCIDIADYTALLSAGWQTVLGGGGELSGSEAATALERYISSTARLMEQRGIALPHIYYSDVADISEACLEVLGEHGIRVVIQGGHDTEQTDRYLGRWWGDMYICGSVTIQDATSHVQLSVYDAGLVGGSMVITTRRITDEDSDPALDCSTVKLGQCLEWLRDAYSVYGFHVIGFDRLYSEKYSSYEQLRTLIGDYETPEQYLSELSRRILELSDLSTDIVEQQYRPLTNGYTLHDFADFVSDHELAQIFELISLRRETTRLYRKNSDSVTAQDYVTDT